MGHLTVEALARLVEEAPTAAEQRHLNACSVCGGELEALKVQTEALGALPDLRPPKGDWEELEARLVSEGLIRSGPLRPYRYLNAGWMQMAAGLVLLLGGTAIGAGFSRSSEPDPGQLVLTSGIPITQVSSVEDAAEAVRLAEESYVSALVRYRELLQESPRGEVPLDPAGRYAALDALVAASQAAVRQAPADPFLNGFLASAEAERQATFRRISTASNDNWY